MHKSSDPLALNSLVRDVLAAARYRDICPDFIRRIGEQELMKRRNVKEALKTTKSKLHQVSGAYFAEQGHHYAAWLAELKAVAQTENKERIQQVGRRIMGYHASTSERLPILDQFYNTILADLAPIHSILDIACGLHPLAIPWMPLAEDAQYYAYDIYQQMTAFLHEWLAIMKIRGHVQARDVVQLCPTHEVEVAFILKTIPCLEQVDKQAGHRLLRAINAQHLIISFPVHSLSGHNKGMATNYEARFRELLGNERWTVKRFAFATELVFVVTK
jgi:16S rRNA (guanine(1405)-N(7))-methyltransferase